MPSSHIYAEITRAHQAEIAAATAQRPHSPRPPRRTSSTRAPFAVRLLRRTVGATS